MIKEDFLDIINPLCYHFRKGKSSFRTFFDVSPFFFCRNALIKGYFLKNSRFFPLMQRISSESFQKLFFMCFAFFLITFAYHVLKDLKDTLVVTAPSSGAEIIPFLKIWVTLPGSLLATLVFSYLAFRYGLEQTAYIFITILICFFLVFAYILHPGGERFCFNEFASSILPFLPEGCEGIAAMIKYWSYALFYLSAELWSTIAVSLVFWAYANEITTLQEAKQYYPIYTLVGSASGILAGQVSHHISKNTILSSLESYKSWEDAFIVLILLVSFCGLGTMLILRWISFRYLKRNPKKKQNIRRGIFQSFHILANSKHLLCVATLVLGYNVIMNLAEVLWKDQVHLRYPFPADFNAFINQTTFMIGILSTVASLFVSFLCSQLKWLHLALITPFFLFFGSILFFTTLSFSNMAFNLFPYYLLSSSSFIAVVTGTILIVMGRTAKYAIFDITKEMALIPLSREEKIQGKAAIDGIGSRLGKVGASFLLQGSLIVFGSLSATVPFAGGFILVIIPLMFGAAKTLGKSMDSSNEESFEQTIAKVG